MGNTITRKSLDSLVSTSKLEQLKKLDLRRNKLKEADLIFLADSPKLQDLDVLRF